MKPYFSFLLRMWQAGTPQNPLWVASLEHPHTHEVICFPSISSLVDYVHALTEEGSPMNPPAVNSRNQTQS